jgi:hypothetical protein
MKISPGPAPARQPQDAPAWSFMLIEDVRMHQKDAADTPAAPALLMLPAPPSIHAWLLCPFARPAPLIVSHAPAHCFMSHAVRRR